MRVARQMVCTLSLSARCHRPSIGISRLWKPRRHLPRSSIETGIPLREKFYAGILTNVAEAAVSPDLYSPFLDLSPPNRRSTTRKQSKLTVCRLWFPVPAPERRGGSARFPDNSTAGRPSFRIA